MLWARGEKRCPRICRLAVPWPFSGIDGVCVGASDQSCYLRSPQSYPIPENRQGTASGNAQGSVHLRTQQLPLLFARCSPEDSFFCPL